MGTYTALIGPHKLLRGIGPGNRNTQPLKDELARALAGKPAGEGMPDLPGNQLSGGAAATMFRPA